MIITDALLEYGAPVAVALTLSVGGMAIKNSTDIAVLETETKNMVQVQQEMVREIREMNRIVYRIDARTEKAYEQR